MDWLVTSIVLSIALTVLLNVVLRAFPGAGDRAARRLDDLVDASGPQDDRPVRVWFPWKAMLVASLVLTVVANLVVRLF